MDWTVVAGYLLGRIEVNHANGIVGAVVERFETGTKHKHSFCVNPYGNKYTYQHVYSLPIQILIAPLKVQRLLLLSST
jgi:hypothetical protein